jgi:hypothetical protein
MDGFGLPLMEDDRLLELGMMVLHEILSRQLHASKKGVAKKKAPAKQKKAVAISDEEVSLTIDDLPDSYDSPAPTHAHDLVTPPAPRKKKAPAKKAEQDERVGIPCSTSPDHLEYYADQIQELAEEVHKADAAPRKKKAPAKAKGGCAASAEEEGRVVEECD